MRYLEAKLALVLFGLAACGMPAPTTHDERPVPSLSADFLLGDQGTLELDMNGRLYLNSMGLRIEYGPDDNRVISIYDFARNAYILLSRDERSYMETTWPDGILDPMDWIVTGTSDPCGQSEDESIRATKLGFETFRGHKVEKWRCDYVDAEGAIWTVWLDPNLSLPMRIEVDDGTVMELRNIDVGPQPAELFQVPRSSKKQELPEGPAMQLELPD